VDVFVMAEQPMPLQDGGTAVFLVAQDAFNDMLAGRTRIGAQRYGRALHTNNGCNPFQDAMEEAVDLWQYLIQARLEHDDLREENARLRALVISLGGTP
jgi:chemotaxis regulatin CheY-phosphate phosphatase CheZ